MASGQPETALRLQGGGDGSVPGLSQGARGAARPGVDGAWYQAGSVGGRESPSGKRAGGGEPPLRPASPASSRLSQPSGPFAPAGPQLEAVAGQQFTSAQVRDRRAARLTRLVGQARQPAEAKAGGGQTRQVRSSPGGRWSLVRRPHHIDCGAGVRRHLQQTH